MLNHTDSVQALCGIGATRAKALSRLQIETVADLLYHAPRGYQERGNIVPLSTVQDGQIAALSLVIGTPPKVARLKKRLTILQFRAYDESAACTVTFFSREFLAKEFEVGAEYRFYGRVRVKRGGRYELNSPAFEPITAERPLADYYAVHRLTQGLSEKLLRSALADACARVDFTHWEPLPPALLAEHSLAPLSAACRNLHFPQSREALLSAQRRFAFEELFLFSLGLCTEHGARKQGHAPAIGGDRATLAPFLQALPYALTHAQERSIAEIATDLRAPDGTPMARLLSGDVGSGKTVCAAAAIYLCLRAGHQSAFMAPTEILARQHYADLAPLLGRLGFSCALLCGSLRASEKRAVLQGLALGEIDLVIGTHALLTDAVQFARLGLVVTDEQHRFGIFQRTALAEKARDPHLLVMSATPIPRTLALILYGDLSLSILDELPPGRQRVDTFCVDESYRPRLDAFIEKQVAAGRQVYIVCPAIEERAGEEEAELTPTLAPVAPPLPLKHAVTYAEQLQARLPGCRVALLHGKQSGAQKDAVMQSFVCGEVDVLVSTTVIEVGVNVPNATLMLVENAERFGLSSLHQLRGRVGRGAHKSYCILVSDSHEERAQARLQALCKSHDGYEIAKQDLAQRGPGDFFAADAQSGARQHGQSRFRFADLCSDLDLLLLAQQSAKALYEADPSLAAHPNTRAALRSLWEAHRNTFH